jgi:carbonic anhydrase
MTDRLVPVERASDIPEIYRSTPIARLLEYHNLDAPFCSYSTAQLLIGMCMDNRKQLHIPDNFAFILRTGGGNLRYSEFKVSYAIAVGGVRAVALMGHTCCGMVALKARRSEFISGLVDVGWTSQQAENHFEQHVPLFEIGNEITFVLSEAIRLRNRYPKVLVAPLIYKVEDNRLYMVRED